MCVFEVRPHSVVFEVRPQCVFEVRPQCVSLRLDLSVCL